MKRVIVPIDFSAASDAALACARALATRHDATVIVLHVLPVAAHGVVYGEIVAVPPVLMTRLEDYQDKKTLRRLHDKIASLGLNSLRTAVKVMRGDIGEAVLEVATEDDLIVVGANQRHLTRPGLGESLCRRTPCPILACHASETADGTIETPTFVSGIAAVDGSELAEDVAYASAKVLEPGGKLEFLHVIDPSPVHRVGTDVDGGPTSPSENAVLTTAETVLAFEEWVTAQQLGVESSGYIASDPPAQALLERAVVAEADFIACGAHRLDRPAPLGLAEILVRHSPVPVLIVNR